MKLFRYFISLAAAAGMLTACETDLEMVEAYPVGEVIPATIHALSGDIVVTADNQEEELVFSWDAADFGCKTQISYSIRASYGGNSVILASGITATSYTTTLGTLNGRLALEVEDGGLGLPLETPASVDFSIGATIGSASGTSFDTVYSAPTSANVSVTKAEKTYPNIWVIGDYCGWIHGNSQFLYSFSEDKVNYEGFIDFGEKAANGFKLTGVGGWDDTCNWGVDGDKEAPAAEASSIQLINSGGSGNIQCYSMRFYKFKFNTSTLLLEKLYGFNQLGVIGGFNSWGGDVVMNFNPEQRRFWADVENLEGEFKFRTDGNWDGANWGAGEGENALAPGAGNIQVAEKGNYRVYAYLSDSNNLYYELDAKMYGQPEAGAPGDTPDEPDEPDTPEVKENLWDVIGNVNGSSWGGAAAYMNEAGPGVWYSSFVKVEGEFKFRYNNSWDVQVGKGAQELVADGSLCAGSSDGGSGNFKLEPGTYQFILYTETKEVRAIAIDGSGWGVIGALAGFNWDTDLMMYKAENGLLAAQGIKLTIENQFKFREGNAWTKSYGFGAMTPNSVVDGNSDNGANITVSEEGVYDLYLDLEGEKIYLMKAGTPISEAAAPGEVEVDLTGYAWGICGTVTSWADGADIVLTVEGDYGVARNVTLTTADEFKLRADGKWDLSYGCDEVVEIGKGTKLTQTMKNIKVSANGTYDLYFGLKSALLYVVEAGQKPEF